MKYLILILLTIAPIRITSSCYQDALSKEQREQVTHYLQEERREKEREERYYREYTKLEPFLNAIGHLESTNNPDTINTFGFIGRFQFGKAALKQTGYDSITVCKFKANKDIFTEEMQIDAMIKLLKSNNRSIKKSLHKHRGRYINDIKITESGLLAACHLAGTGNVIKYLESNGQTEFSDAYNTTLSKYLKEFSNYKFNIDLL